MLITHHVTNSALPGVAARTAAQLAAAGAQQRRSDRGLRRPCRSWWFNQWVTGAQIGGQEGLTKG